MRYSLYSRFRGTLLGAAVGEMLGKPPSVFQQTADSQWNRLAVVGIQSLIRLGRFDLDDWLNVFDQDLMLSQKAVGYEKHVSTKAIIAAVPIALFYHDNEIKLRQNVIKLGTWQDESVGAIIKESLLNGALAVGYAIAQSLTEKLNPATLISEIIVFLGDRHTQVAQHLAQVQTLLEQGAGLEQAVTELVSDAQPSTPIALAFYCFLSTLEDLRLSVLRAVKTGYQPQITSAITGALSGAYNSTVGIPSSWRLALSGSDVKPLAAWGMTTEAEMLVLSDSLVAVWSGIYDRKTNQAELTPVTAIAAPRVIR